MDPLPGTTRPAAPSAARPTHPAFATRVRQLTYDTATIAVLAGIAYIAGQATRDGAAWAATTVGLLVSLHVIAYLLDAIAAEEAEEDRDP